MADATRATMLPGRRSGVLLFAFVVVGVVLGLLLVAREPAAAVIIWPLAGTAALASWAVASACRIRRLTALLEQHRAAAAAERTRLSGALEQREQAEQELRRSLALMIRSAADGIITYGADGRIRDANRAAAHLLGREPAELRGASLPGLLGVPEPGDLIRPGAHVEVPAGRSPERITEWTISGHPMSGDDGYLAIIRDITERSRLQRELSRRADYDDTTGLPKRPLFTRLLDEHLASDGSQDVAGVLAVGLDDFDTLQDAFGYDDTHNVLRTLAARLSRLVADRGGVGAFDRVGFLVWVDNGAGPVDLLSWARRIQQVIAEPVELDGNRVVVTASIGVTRPDRHASTWRGTDAVKEAGAALSRARRYGTEGLQEYANGIQAEARRTAVLDHALRTALPAGQFRLFFQPVVSLRTGHVVSAEALLRWDRPGIGLVSPEDFLPRLESSGLIVPVGDWVLDEACRQLSAWHARIRRPDPDARLPRVSVNLSALQFAHAGLPQQVFDTVARHGLQPSDLVLEVTESTALDSRFEVDAQLAQLRAAGCQIALDDFGTGFSALSQVLRVDVDIVKLDKTFLDSLVDDGRYAALVGGIVAISRSLGLRTVAEGVETREQLRRLQDMGCDRVQGHLLAPPKAPAAGLGPCMRMLPEVAHRRGLRLSA